MTTTLSFLRQLRLLCDDIECAQSVDARLRDRWTYQLRSMMERHIFTTDNPDVIRCMGSADVCARNGCQFHKTDGYSAGKGPVF